MMAGDGSEILSEVGHSHISANGGSLMIHFLGKMISIIALLEDLSEEKSFRERKRKNLIEQHMLASFLYIWPRTVNLVLIYNR